MVRMVRVVRLVRMVRERLVTNLEKLHFCVCCCLKREKLIKSKSKVVDPQNPWVP